MLQAGTMGILVCVRERARESERVVESREMLYTIDYLMRSVP